MDTLLDLTTPAPLPLNTLVVNLLLSILLASALAWFYSRYGKSLNNRGKFAQHLPMLAIITTLVISVVKSSLALSLGLVGALSIVRFRTAIKEPEELLYLFAAIAIGLGLGADQRAATIVAVLVILGYLAVKTVASHRPHRSNLYLNVLAPTTDNSFNEINHLLLEHVESANLRRLDRNGTTIQATYLIRCSDDVALTSLMDDLSSKIPDSELSFVEQDNTFGA
jgi:uncharacterized membrane protein YhiD involved in acid resistance